MSQKARFLALFIAIPLLSAVVTIWATPDRRCLLGGCNNPIDVTRRQIRYLSAIIQDYQKQCGQYPSTAQGLQALVQVPVSGPACIRYPSDGFLKVKELPKDGFNRPFLYSSDGSDFELKSMGIAGDPDLTNKELGSSHS